MTKAEYFRKEIFRWVKFFGLSDYEIDIDDECTDARADCSWYGLKNEDAGTQIIRISYNPEWIKTADMKLISRTAFHEVCELLIAPLTEFARNTDVRISEREISTERHRIIRRLESSVWEKLK